MQKRWQTILWTGLAFGVFILLRFVVFDIYRIRGQSMAPSLADGTIVLVMRSTFSPALSPGMLVMARTKKDSLVKRVLALGPALVEWTERGIRVDGRPVVSYTNAQTVPLPGNTIVKKNMVFLIGDNPEESIDSRTFGAIDEKNILGQVILSFKPFW